VEIPNPFREGQDKAYADLLLDKQKEMKWWRGIIGVGFLLLFMISLFFNVHAVSQQKTVPVLVNVMPSGEAQYLGEVRQNAALTVPEAAVQYQVRKFITNLRSVSTDPQVLYNNIDECYAMITNRYEPIMTRSLRGNSPFDLVGKTRRSVEVESVLKITGSSYQVDFFEVSTDNQGARRTARFRALATVILLPVGDDAIKKNPLGIYIENYEVTEL
jgi:type IV secretion system protein VirB5